MKKILNILFLGCGLAGLRLAAQDIHFSQYNGSVLNMSPAFTGFFDGDYRVNGIYRSQWQAVPVPYRTFSFAGDTRIKLKNMKSDCIGVGLLVNSDKAGDAFYTTNQFYLSGSYIHKATMDSSLLIGAGFSFGLNSLGFNYNKMTFDNQFDGVGYSSSLATGEKFQQTSTTYADLNVGLSAQYAFKKIATFTYAFSFNHLSSPVISYQGNAYSKLDAKLLNYLAAAVPVGSNVVLNPELLYSHQGKYNEFVPGAMLRYIFNPEKNNTASIGFYYRAKDAFISRLGYTYGLTTAGISYDLNTSKFIAATNRRGAFELYITHIIRKNRPFVAKKRVCPVYM
ncbi:MAG: PorP/SprF family type IX secretion system membrane protein [Bacteroidia bacterium]